MKIVRGNERKVRKGKVLADKQNERERKRNMQSEKLSLFGQFEGNEKNYDVFMSDAHAQ